MASGTQPNISPEQTLYTFEQTMHLVTRLQAKKVLFVHLEEY